MPLQVTIGGTNRIKHIIRKSFKIDNIMTRQIDRCKFTFKQLLKDGTSVTPTVGQEVVVYDTDSTKIFGGNISE